MQGAGKEILFARAVHKFNVIIPFPTRKLFFSMKQIGKQFYNFIINMQSKIMTEPMNEDNQNTVTQEPPEEENQQMGSGNFREASYVILFIGAVFIINAMETGSYRTPWPVAIIITLAGLGLFGYSLYLQSRQQ